MINAKHIGRLGVTIVIAVVGFGALAKEVAAGERSVIGVSDEGSFDAAYGRAIYAAREAAKANGEKAFYLDSVSGLKNRDGTLNRLVVRFGLLPELPTDLTERATGRASASLERLVQETKPPLEDQEQGREIADAMHTYYLAHVIGTLEEGGVPPQLWAVARSEPFEADELDPTVAHTWAGKLPRQSGGVGGEALQHDLDETLEAAARALPATAQRFAYRVKTWGYRLGRIAGFDDSGALLEARVAPPELVQLALPAEPAEAVEALRPLIEAHRWADLARHYDLGGASVDAAELLSGAYFHRQELRPPVVDPAGLWGYRHPFHPLARLFAAEETDDPAVIALTMAVEIDQGGDGPMQRILSTFHMKRTPDGLFVLPN